MTQYPIGIQNFQGLREDGYQIAEANGIDKNTCYERLKKGYDGYHFHENCVGGYYLFSLLSALDSKEFKDYWFKTETPTFLVETLKRNNYELENMAREEVSSDLLGSLNSIDICFHNVVYVVFKMLGFYVDVERHTSDGRLDMLIQTKDYIYILEFKMDRSADEALAQIEEKQYAKPFAQDSRKLYKIGVNFSSATRRIESWKIV